MKMKNILMAAAIMLTAMPLANAQSTQKLSATKANEYGLIYTLPANEFDITLEAEGTVEKPGEFYQYARIYLGVDPIMRPSSKWVLKSAMIAETAVPDKEEEYLVQFKAGSTPYMLVSSDGYPLTVNATEVIELPEAAAAPVARAMQPTVLEANDASYAITPEMLAATSIAKRAELAAARIFEIRQTRTELISGQSENQPQDGAALKLMLDNLSQQEAVLTAMFLGTRQTCTAVTSLHYVPADDSERVVIARLSATKGFVDPTDLSGDPIYLNLDINERGKLPLNEKGEVKKFPKGGLAYRIPGRATVSIDYAGRDYARLSCAVAQYGVVFGIDPLLFTDKKAPAYLQFDPLTGGIRELGALQVTTK